MNRCLGFVRGLIAASALLLGVPPASAAEKWDFSSPYPDSYMIKNIRVFADEVKQKTGGKIEMVVHPNASLYKLPETKRAIQSGQLPIGEITPHGFTNEDPMFGLFTMPFLMRNKDDAWKLWEASRPYIEKRFENQGIKVVYSCAWPAQSLFTKIEIKSFADLKGKKFRTQGPTTARLAELMGVSGIEVQTADLPQAFLTGIIDGMYTSDVTTRDLKGWDYLKYSYQVNSWYPINVIIMSRKHFDGLDAPTKKAFEEAGAAAEKRGWAMETEASKEALVQLQKNGMKIVQPPAQLMAEFHKIGQQMIEEWKKAAGPDGAAVIAAYNKKRKM